MANLYSRRFKCLLRPFFALGNEPANLELGQCLQLQNLAPLEAFFCTSKGTVHLVNNQFLQLHILAPLADIFCTSNGASLFSTWPICTAAAISAPPGHFLHLQWPSSSGTWPVFYSFSFQCPSQPFFALAMCTDENE